MTAQMNSSVHSMHPDSTSEKDLAVMHLEDQQCRGISTDDAEFLANFSEDSKKKVLRKVS